MLEPTCKCKKSHKKILKNSYLGVFSGLFIALLPKCPFCLLAYSSAITLCSGKTLYPESVNYLPFIVITLSLLTLFFVLYNYKGRKTIYAAGFIIVGSVILYLYYYINESLMLYYAGVAFLLTGVWTNGSLSYFLRSIQNSIVKLLKINNETAAISTTIES